jgi:MYXO-CTERM domain-containing protein
MVREDALGERLAAVFLLGLVLFSPLLYRLFDRGADTTVAGIPLLPAYAFGAWGLVILLLALAVRRSRRSGDDRDG